MKNYLMSGTSFSECGNHRKVLWRIWNDNKPNVTFIGLNPSTANQSDDPTIRRVVGLAANWGFGGVYMCNLFTIVSADPTILVQHPQPNLEDANYHLFNSASHSDKVIFAWGAFKEAKTRAQEVAKMFDGYCLAINKDGSPKHPLYVRKDTQPIIYQVA